MGEDGAALSRQAGDPGRSGKDNRLFIEAVLWIARTAALAGSAALVRPLE